MRGVAVPEMINGPLDDLTTTGLWRLGEYEIEARTCLFLILLSFARDQQRPPRGFLQVVQQTLTVTKMPCDAIVFILFFFFFLFLSIVQQH